MPVETQTLAQYFDRIATHYDAIYSGETGFWSSLLNRFVYKDVYRRFTFTFNNIDGLKGKKILDVGCGSGRYMLEAGRRGAQHVYGVDLSGNMLELAKKMTDENGVKNRCKFVQGDFLQQDLNTKFDITFAMGLFDYTENPTAILRRIFLATSEFAAFTFPDKWTPQSVLKNFNLLEIECPLYSYSKQQVLELLAIAGFEALKIEKNGQYHFVIARPRVKIKGAYR